MSSFEDNLNDIIDIGLRSGAKVLVSTVARNLKDCGPFASEHRPGLTADELSRWDDFYQTGIRAQEAGRPADAIGSFGQASKLDDTYAEAPLSLGPMFAGAGPGRGGIAPVHPGL